VCHRESATRDTKNTCTKGAAHTHAATNQGGRAAAASPATYAEVACVEEPYTKGAYDEDGLIYAQPAVAAACGAPPPPSPNASMAPPPPRPSASVFKCRPCSSCGEETGPQLH
jgi:hypothetical protein